MLCRVIRVFYESELVTLDASWNNLWFLFSSLLYMINICKPPRSSLWWQLTAKELKKMKQQKSPLSSLPPSPLPCPLIPLFFFTLMCFCSPWRWRGETKGRERGGQILLHIWGLFGLPLGSAVKLCISRKLPALSGRLGTLSNTLSHKHSHTYTHTHAPQLA